MKLKIQYTVDEANLPKEIEGLFKRKKDKFENALSFSSIAFLKSIELEDYPTALQYLSNLRKNLYDLDVLMDDLDSILTGYVEYEQSKNQPTEQQEVVEEQ